jgi:hypothetical protein
MKNLTGVITHFPVQVAEKDPAELSVLPFMALPSGDKLIEQAIDQVHEVCDEVVILVHEHLVENAGAWMGLETKFGVKVVFVSELNPGRAIQAWIRENNTSGKLVLLQLRWVYSFDFSLSHALSRVPEEQMGDAVVFGENYFETKFPAKEGIEPNLRTVDFSEGSEIGFITVSGKFVRWNGIAILDADLIQTLNFSAEDTWPAPSLPVFGISDYFESKVPDSCNLQGCFGSGAVTLIPFSVCVLSSRSYDFLNEKDVQAYFDELPPEFLMDFYSLSLVVDQLKKA